MGIREMEKRLVVFEPVEVVFNPKKSIARCRMPYPKHSSGCPNWGVKEGCPPGAGVFDKVYLPEARVIAVELNFGRYLEMRRVEHPEWTEAALRNQRHFQSNLRVALREGAERNIREGEVFVNSPEAMGVDVTETCRRVGIEIEWPPEEFFYQVGLLARRL